MFQFYPLKRQEKNASENQMSSAEVVCCKKLPNITDKLSIEANSVVPEQTEQSDLGPQFAIEVS